MPFLIDIALFALMVIVITAFMGALSTNFAQLFGGKKKTLSLEKTVQSKKGWKRVERKHT
jgi:CRISPR/Cas system-associated protein Cas5 (RAMP superfamily)